MKNPANSATNGCAPTQLHDLQQASSWVKRWSPLVKPGGSVLDVACGRGRHACWFAALNHPVTVVDRSQEAIDSIALPATSCTKIVADIESGSWPLTGQLFDAVVVTNYLWRPLMPALLACLAPGGVLIYETFASGNETVGKPSNPDFLLRTGELLEICQGLRVVGFEDGFLPPTADRNACFVQRIAAVKAAPANVQPARYLLA